MNRLPAYAKALIAAVPTAAAVVAAVIEALGEASVAAPSWLVALAAVLTNLAVYAVPNRELPRGEEGVV